LMINLFHFIHSFIPFILLNKINCCICGIGLLREAGTGWLQRRRQHATRCGLRSSFVRSVSSSAPSTACYETFARHHTLFSTATDVFELLPGPTCSCRGRVHIN
jgi:hypothetical protein